MANEFKHLLEYVKTNGACAKQWIIAVRNFATSRKIAVRTSMTNVITLKHAKYVPGGRDAIIAHAHERVNNCKIIPTEK